MGKYCSDCAVQGRLSIPSHEKYFKRSWTQVKTFLKPLAPDGLFFPFKNSFYEIILKTVRDIEKMNGIKFQGFQILHRQEVSSFWISLIVFKI